nr:MAG TPA: hypothetical protein [Microviridae sp.]
MTQPVFWLKKLKVASFRAQLDKRSASACAKEFS